MWGLIPMGRQKKVQGLGLIDQEIKSEVATKSPGLE